MAPLTTEELIDVGLEHLARFAFFTRDNPFLSSQAAVRLPPRHREVLIELLDGRLDIDEWLASESAQTLLKGVQVGCVPRNIQLVTEDGQPKVGIADVHAFLRAPLFWWLASILWCLTAGRRLDPYLDEEIKGYRLHKGFVEEPGQRGLMFRDYRSSYQSWKGFAASVSAQFPGEVLATNTIDLRDFYYSSTAPPRRIVSRFLKSKGKRLRSGQRSDTLTKLLDALHGRYAARCRDIKPRPYLSDRSAPLPVGLPSSRILANLIVSLARDDLASMEQIDGVAVYADDLLLMTRELPAVAESSAEYLARLGLIPAEGEAPTPQPTRRRRRGDRSRQHRQVLDLLQSQQRQEEGGVEEACEDPKIDPYIEGNPDPHSGGRLRTVLSAPHRPERVPRELSKELEQLVDEIRIGLSAEEAKPRLEKFIEEIDAGLFRPFAPIGPICSSWGSPPTTPSSSRRSTLI